MRNFILSVFALLLVSGAYAQTYPFVSITDINQPADLTNCNDSSAYFGDTIRTIGVVVTDGSLSEVASSSVIGGYRPFIHIVDTTNNGVAGPYKGLELQAVYQTSTGSFQALAGATNLLAGDIIEVVGYLDSYNSNLQLNTLNANAITIVGSQSAPASVVVPVSDLNDANRVNNVQTGEKWEGAFGELQNVTVSEVIPFGNGRVSFNVVDAAGNKINVSDRFLAQKTSSYQVVNPNSPSTTGTGSFVAPAPGTFYTSIKGIIRQDGNGCTGGTGRGYEINPFDPSHYNIGFAPPYITDVERDPLIPNANQGADISATITDFDGTVDSVIIAWSTSPTAAPSTFTKYNMTLAIGSSDQYEYTIPKQANGTQVRYYIYAEDNDGNPSYYPAKPVGQVEPNVQFYTIRPNGLTIQDIQKTFDPSGDSPYKGQTVTVRGVATASQMDYDLGYVYIQDPSVNEYAGISLTGSLDLQNVFRNEWIEVTGDVVENYGLTQLVVSKVVKLGATDTIQPIAINPSDSTGRSNNGWEKYEDMLVKYENPTPGGKLYITDPDVSFGDYSVATDPNYGFGKSGLVLAGRQSSNSASSLWVQLVSDTIYQNVDGAMFLPAVATSDTMTMDAVVGLMTYDFGNYRVLPRANDDIIGLNASLDNTINRPNNVGIQEYFNNTKVAMYPNPANDVFTISTDSKTGYTATVYDLNGRMVMQESSARGEALMMNVSRLVNGIYLIKVTDPNHRTMSSGKMVVNH